MLILLALNVIAAIATVVSGIDLAIHLRKPPIRAELRRWFRTERYP